MIMIEVMTAQEIVILSQRHSNFQRFSPIILLEHQG